MSDEEAWERRLTALLEGDPNALEEALTEADAGRTPSLRTQADLVIAWRCVVAMVAYREAVRAVEAGSEHADARLQHAFEVSRTAMRGLPAAAALRPTFAARVVEGLVVHGEAILGRQLGLGEPDAQQQWILGSSAVGLAWQLVDLGGLEAGLRATLTLRLLQMSTPPGGLPAAIRELEECGETLAEGTLWERVVPKLALGDIYVQFGDHERAAPLATAAEAEIATATSEDAPSADRLRVFAVSIQARALILGDAPSEALEAIEAVRPIATQAAPELLPALRYASAYGLLAAGNPNGCLEALREEDIRPMTVMASGRVDLLAGRALRVLGRGVEAEATLERALPASAADPDAVWRSHAELAGIREEAGDRGIALRHLLDATTQIEQFRGKSVGYRLDSTMLRQRLPVFREAIRLAVSAGDASRTANLIESVKQRGVDALFGVERSAAADPEARMELQTLSAKLDELEYHALRLRYWPPDALHQARDLAQRRATVLEALNLEGSFDRSAIPDGDDSLPPAETAELTLFLDEPRRTVVAVLRNGGLTDVQERRLAAETVAALERYRDNLTRPDPEEDMFDPDRALGLHADTIVPSGILRRALEASSLVVSPHGLLHLLPWPSLSVRGDRLVELLPVGVVPSITMGHQLRRRPLARDPSVAVIGAPTGDGAPALKNLPLVGLELADVTELYGANGRLLRPSAMGSAGTQSAFFESAQARDASGHILHVACHGSLDADDPLSAGLMLADGKVDVAELSQLRIGYGEVVLSSCSSGWRPLRAGNVELLGDDAVSLVGSFLAAGAASVLASIPLVFDREAHALMTAYHARRIAGVGPMVALRDVQLEALAGGAQPHTVSGFVVNGCH